MYVARSAGRPLEHARVNFARHKLTIAGMTEKIAVHGDGPAAQDRHARPGRHLPAFPRTVVGHVEVGHAQASALARVHEHDVGVTAYGQNALARIQAKDPGGIARRDVDKLAERHAPLADTFGVDDTHARFGPEIATRDIFDRAAHHFHRVRDRKSVV